MSEDDRFIEEYRPLVQSIVGKLRAGLDLNCDPDDLIAFGMKGLVEARGRYDPSRGVQFNTFAYYRIRGSVLDGIRQMAYLPRRAHALRRAAEGADTVAEEAGDARAAAAASGGRDTEATVVALDDALGKMTASFVIASLGQSQEDAGRNPEAIVIEADQAARVRRALDGLPERERALVDGFYFQGRRFDEVADELGISKSWASRLHTKALALLREALAGTGTAD